MALGPNHLDNIDVQITLQEPASQVVSFSIGALVATDVTLDGDRIRTYNSIDAVVADEAAGFVSASVTAAATAYFSQSPSPDTLKVIARDFTGSAESFTDAITAARGEDCDFFGICIDSRAAADIQAVMQYVEARELLFIFQSADADWLTAGVPAAMSAYDGAEKSAGLYHDNNLIWGDMRWLGNAFAFDPDDRSAPWDRGVDGVQAYTALLNDTQKQALDGNNMNHGLPYGSASFFVDPGENGKGRPIHEIVTAAWFKNRLISRTADAKVSYSAEGAKFPVSLVGQAILISIAEGLFSEGVAGNHFEPGQTEVEALPITDADRAARRLRIRGAATFEGSTHLFSFAFDFSRDPINVE